MGAVADAQVVLDADAPAAKRTDLSQQNLRVDDDARADDRHEVRPQDAAGHQVQGELFRADPDGMAGIGAAAVADRQVVLLGKQIDDFALALIAPLQAYDAGVPPVGRIELCAHSVTRFDGQCVRKYPTVTKPH